LDYIVCPIGISVLCVEKIVFSCGSGDHAAAEKNTQCFSSNVAEKRVPLSVLCVEKIVFSCGAGDHAAAEKNTQCFSREKRCWEKGSS
jgi:hypothetical protein